MKFINFLLFIFISTSCSHRPALNHQDTLFQQGTYKHTVRIQPVGSAEMPFKGVLSFNSEELKLYLLGPMDITAIKIVENFHDEKVLMNVSVEDFKKYETQLRYFYDILRTFILFPKSKTEWGQLKLQDGIYYGPHHLTIEVKKMATNHPLMFEMKHPKFTASIEEMP